MSDQQSPGGLGWTSAPPAAPAMSKFAQDIRELDRAAFDAAVEERRKQYGTVTSQTYDDTAATQALKLAPQAIHAFNVQNGVAVDVSGVDPRYIAELEARGVTQSQIVETAQRLRPDLSKADALRWWSAKASKMKGADLRQGANYDSRTGSYHVEESSD